MPVPARHHKLKKKDAKKISLKDKEIYNDLLGSNDPYYFPDFCHDLTLIIRNHPYLSQSTKTTYINFFTDNFPEMVLTSNFIFLESAHIKDRFIIQMLKKRAISEISLFNTFGTDLETGNDLKLRDVYINLFNEKNAFEAAIDTKTGSDLNLCTFTMLVDTSKNTFNATNEIIMLSQALENINYNYGDDMQKLPAELQEEIISYLDTDLQDIFRSVLL